MGNEQIQSAKQGVIALVSVQLESNGVKFINLKKWREVGIEFESHTSKSRRQKALRPLLKSISSLVSPATANLLWW